MEVSLARMCESERADKNEEQGAANVINEMPCETGAKLLGCAFQYYYLNLVRIMHGEFY